MDGIKRFLTHALFVRIWRPCSRHLTYSGEATFENFNRDIFTFHERGCSKQSRSNSNASPLTICMFYIEGSILDRGRGDELRKGDGCETERSASPHSIFMNIRNCLGAAIISSLLLIHLFITIVKRAAREKEIWRIFVITL